MIDGSGTTVAGATGNDRGFYGSSFLSYHRSVLPMDLVKSPQLGTLIPMEAQTTM